MVLFIVIRTTVLLSVSKYIFSRHSFRIFRWKLHTEHNAEYLGYDFYIS